MSQALDDFAVVMEDGYAFFGDAALYTARGAAPVPVVVLIDTNLAPYGNVASVAGKTVALAVRTSQVPAMPRAGDVFAVTAGAFSGRSFRVDSVLESDALEHRVLAA